MLLLICVVAIAVANLRLRENGKFAAYSIAGGTFIYAFLTEPIRLGNFHIGGYYIYILVIQLGILLCRRWKIWGKELASREMGWLMLSTGTSLALLMIRPSDEKWPLYGANMEEVAQGLNSAFDYPLVSGVAISRWVLLGICLPFLNLTRYVGKNWGHYLNAMGIYGGIYLATLAIEVLSEYGEKGQIFSYIYELVNGREALQNSIRGGFHTLQGFTREPAHIGYFGTMVLVAVKKGPQGRLRMLLGGTIAIAMFISGSFTNIVLICAMFLLIAIENRVYLRKVWTIFIERRCILLTAASLLLVVLFCSHSDIIIVFKEYLKYMGSRFGLSIGMKSIGFTASESIRYENLVIGVKAFVSRPLFGYGVSTLSIPGAIIGIMSSLGLVGTYVYIRVIRELIGKEKRIRLEAVPVIVSYLLFSYYDNIIFTPIIPMLFTSCIKEEWSGKDIHEGTKSNRVKTINGINAEK